MLVKIMAIFLGTISLMSFLFREIVLDIYRKKKEDYEIQKKKKLRRRLSAF